MNDCNNCAWFCHSDQKCYIPSEPEPIEIPKWLQHNCLCWQFDGLSDLERAELDALMTMEKTP